MSVLGFGIVLNMDKVSGLTFLKDRIAEIRALINMPDVSDELKDVRWEFYKKGTAEDVVNPRTGELVQMPGTEVKFFLLVTQQAHSRIIDFITKEDGNLLFQIMWFNQTATVEIMRQRLLNWMRENADVCKILEPDVPITSLD